MKKRERFQRYLVAAAAGLIFLVASIFPSGVRGGNPVDSYFAPPYLVSVVGSTVKVAGYVYAGSRTYWEDCLAAGYPNACVTYHDGFSFNGWAVDPSLVGSVDNVVQVSTASDVSCGNNNGSGNVYWYKIVFNDPRPGTRSVNIQGAPYGTGPALYGECPGGSPTDYASVDVSYTIGP